MTLLQTEANPILNISIFIAFVILTLGIVIYVSSGGRAKKGKAYYTGGAEFSGTQNGFAIAGDYLSAASFLGIVGAVAIYGYDGLLFSIGYLVAWLVALLLVAEPMRNTGRYTMADVLSFRTRQSPVRMAASISTLVISFFYLLAQMVGAGSLVAVLLGIEGGVAQILVISIVGILMMVYVLIGGMKGTTWVQMIKAVLLILGAGAMTIWVLGLNRMNFSSLLGDAANEHPEGVAILQPMLQYGANPLGFISLAIAVVLGCAGLPHVLMRFYTVPTAKEARRSVAWAIALIGLFYLFTMVMGYGAAVLVGRDAILDAPGQANAAAPLLALELGGSVLMGVISGVAFATILAVVAGLAIAASASFAHDIYNNVIHKGTADPAKEIRVARIVVIILGILAIVGGVAAKDINVAFLVSLAFAIAASANLPSILFSLYWKKFNTRGALWSIYGGLFTAIVLIAFSPVVFTPIGATEDLASAMFPGIHLAWFPLTNPALVSVPVGFLLAIIGSLTSKEENEAVSREMEVRSMTGVGTGEVLQH
ncbi:MAG TPA: cation/acetate symporter ActP [Propionibacterium sp.]|nr:cation/acetate symporter ActP [Propionibacterium sp.]